MTPSSTHVALRRIGLGGITGSPIALAFVLVVMALLLALPFAHNDYLNIVFRNILMYAAMAYGWNLIGGYTGYVSFGNVTFFGLGAYCSAVLSQAHVDNLVADVALAVVVAVAFAVALGFPLLRLRGHYFAIATLGVGLAVADVVANLDALGGTSGLALHQDNAHFWIYYYAMWVVALASILGTYAIARSKLGYAFVAIRENEDAAAVLGISPTRYKITAWAIGAAMAGAAGAVFGVANGFIDPSITFAPDSNVFPIVMTILGGIGTVAGPFIGALILAGVNELLQRYFVNAHTLFFGAMIVLVVLLLPRGLVWLFGMRGGARAWLATLTAYKA
ncbi:MAG TPA: branched-chain amino acid ABC transporter permease [Candidatus Baltobacteraceae bacterium]|nr:branched-chain amino acid ABC transporter permease [Candidatus Baltobacteraceae bacterium]